MSYNRNNNHTQDIKNYSKRFSGLKFKINLQIMSDFKECIKSCSLFYYRRKLH